ncbi:MAG: hypothetical protein IGS38_24210 [Synechococcales cyanobacterium M58_A2018_015]|nr:hypothetical protein [Synechococcales cyanobacterium M58_A2018_015]
MSQSAEDRSIRQSYCCPAMPLAVYREVVAHLRQVEGVSAGLLPQVDPTFDYRQSQVGGLWLHCPQDDAVAQQRVEQILAYYGNRYGAWQSIAPSLVSGATLSATPPLER